MRHLKKQLSEYKHIGAVTATATLLLVFISNTLLSTLNININLSINGLSIYVNCTLLIILLLSSLQFKKISYRPVYIAFSAFIFQNLLISGTDNLLHRLVGYESYKEGAFILIIPLAIIGTLFWGIFLDYRKNQVKQ